MDVNEAQVAVLAAQEKYDGLRQVAAMVERELPLAEQALESARARLIRIKRQNGVVARSRKDELAAIRRQIAALEAEEPGHE
ncbi:hypothetical protein D3C77_153440 [compost metagenome]